MKNFKKILLSILLTLSIISPSVTVFATTVDTSNEDRSNPIEHALSLGTLDEVFYFDTQPRAYNSDADYIDVSLYQNWRFYNESRLQPVALQMDCDTITVYATCEDENVVDEDMIFHIVDITHEGLFDTAIPFTADGSYTTCAIALPEGLYNVWFTGNSNIKKSYGMGVFSKFQGIFRDLQMPEYPSEAYTQFPEIFSGLQK